MSETRTGALVHGLSLDGDVTSCCGLDPGTLPNGDEVVEPSTDLALVSCAGLCRRCGRRPGRERYYKPGHPGEVSYSLAGVTPKVSVRQTVGCGPCWAEFTALREEVGYPEPNGHVGPDRSEDEVVEAELVPGALVPTTFLGQPPLGYREFGDPWPPPSGHWSTRVLASLRRARSWLPWVVVWLVGLALVVVGGGFDGVTAAVGLVATGAGGALFVRWLWEALS